MINAQNQTIALRSQVERRIIRFPAYRNRFADRAVNDESEASSIPLQFSHGLDNCQQTLGTDLVGIAQTITVANIPRALTIVGEFLRATDPPAYGALGGLIAPYQRHLADVGRNWFHGGHANSYT
ncbi:hypothetical protein GNF76_26150 [Pseudomonas sp. CCM 7893]|uniref:Uncharacterized protein n=1 Tax=Pseudomonas spelaei TaxID=1055469 RepID=A0A6I3WHR5_9PSED|nr:hypothetical protein [Pseudomonas spelaei]MUF07831.1 hypothetical protein [Pseudomonas spelaei]